ncbi:hypothetical protein AJ79_01634 [Helicocarpus griseus UAMH5409]|uniref:Ecp2 effector protein domain-containing protein n=1 Tax=Helicocarpus griseus UAMH5409 TaxID=1447875 RepID=A0A2B7Y608_9EURO|nr:hypothetical protein AJ79_01634 [Helicocarpus griseus UAMH5409]
MLKKFLLVATLAANVLANPLPTNENTIITRRDDKVGSEDLCAHKPDSMRSQWYVFATKESMPINQRCGAGYLDNLRGECGWVIDWGCKFVDENAKKVEEKEKNEDQIKGAIMTFVTAGTCSGSHIKRAMKVASAAEKGPDDCINPPDWIVPN